MGQGLSSFLGEIFGNKTELRILMLGLDNAGKSTILYRLKLDKLVKTIPTVGFNVETIHYKNVKLSMWDVGGQGKIRSLWRHYFRGTHGLIFVVDSSDRARMEEAQKELQSIVKDRDMRLASLLVLANKQDAPDAMSPEELIDELGLRLIADRLWYVRSTCAKNGEGLTEGLAWLVQNCKDLHLKLQTLKETPTPRKTVNQPRSNKNRMLK